MFENQDFLCVKKLLAPAERILESRSAIFRRPYDERIKLWYEVKGNYSRYEHQECGTFDRGIFQNICSKFEVALLTLAVSFRRNGERYVDAEGSYSEDDFALYEIIERYHIIPSKGEFIAILSAPDAGGSEFLQVHYRYIDSLNNGRLLQDTSAGKGCLPPGPSPEARYSEGSRICDQTQGAAQFSVNARKSTLNNSDLQSLDTSRTTSEICNRPHAANSLLTCYLKNAWENYDRRLREAVIDHIRENGVRWIFNINLGSVRAERNVYNISGGSVNLGEGVQVIDSIMNRAGIVNQPEG